MTPTIRGNRFCRPLFSLVFLFVAFAAVASAAPAPEKSVGQTARKTPNLATQSQAALAAREVLRGQSLPSTNAIKSIFLGGTIGWSLAGSTLHLTAQNICNTGPEDPTGSLRLELWAFSAPFSGSESGYKLAESSSLSPLHNQVCDTNYDSGAVSLLTVPPDGQYYTVMFLDEFTNAGTDDGFSYVDFIQFSEAITVSSGIISVNTTFFCNASATTLCIDDQLLDQRFQVQVSFATSQGAGASGNGQAISLSSVGVPHGGLLWFFSADNPELLVKILPACGVNGHHWVFASAGTNVGLTITVTDTKTGLHKTYTNADLHPMTPIQDTGAFTCP